MRKIRIGGAQMGAVQREESRTAVVSRMLDLLEQAGAAGCTLVAFPELCLTTFFPRWWMEDPVEINAWFEREMPNAATRPLFDRAADLGIAISLGYAELTPEGRRFNSSILTDRRGRIVGKYRKVHLPGHSEYDPARAFQHLEKRYFEPGDLGFPVWRNLDAWMGMCICNDRRWSEVWRSLGLQGVELVLLGYNTPSVNSQLADEAIAKRLYHSELSVCAGAYQNATWAVAVAKGGVEDGSHLMAGSIIVDPDGMVVARAESEEDELLVHEADMDATRFGKETIFDFARHRRPEHYQRICRQTGVELPRT